MATSMMRGLSEARGSIGSLAQNISSLISGDTYEGSDLQVRKRRIQEGLQKAGAAGLDLEEAGLAAIEAGEADELRLPPCAAQRIAEASYGALDGSGDTIDVLERVQADLLAGRAVAVSNEALGGDPRPGTRKVLRVKYQPTSDPIVVNVEEGKELLLPEHASEGITSATYGSGDAQRDVVLEIHAALRDAAGNAVVVSNELLGCDPAPGAAKTLTVTFLPGRTRLGFKLQTSRELANFEVVAPWLFSAQRAASGWTCREFYAELTSSDLKGGEKQAAGKSGEIFWFSAGRHFVLKTISNEEVDTLVRMLPDYTAYIAANKDSLLTRYLGVYSLSDNSVMTQFVVMNNVFDGAPEFDVMYDLKGTTEDRWVDPAPGKCLKDNNFADVTLYFDDDNARSLHRAISSDTRWLEKQGIMDYSLMCALAVAGQEAPGAAGKRYSRLMGGLPALQARGVLEDSMRDVAAFVGVVDMLVTYGWKKKAAHTFKSMTIGITEEIDTMPPQPYASRFRSFFAQKFRGRSEKLSVTEVSPDCFESPMPALGRSGGTAAFFKVVYKEGATQAEAQQSRLYWIGKDLARAKDEVDFCEKAKHLQGNPDWELLQWMTPYLGVCRALCEVRANMPPSKVDLMLLRNGRDGFRTCRMLDIKIGQVTAVAGWQGKSAFSAWVQSNTVDAHTNSAGQGFRLEGFDSPPAALRSVEDLLTEASRAVSATSEKQRKKLRRFNLQRQSAAQFLGHFLDLHDSSGSSYAGYKKDKKKADPLAGVDGASALTRAETQELVLLSCIEELAAFIASCRRAPAPQQWIGSSVMLAFDCGSLPARQVLDRGRRQWGAARVHVFDWGRSALDTPALHERLEAQDKAQRQQYWGFYCGAVARLLYDCCSVYVTRYLHTKRSASFTVWDKDQFTADDFIGMCVLPLEESNGPQKLVDFVGGAVSKSGFLRGGAPELTVSLRPVALPEGSRLRDCWAVRVHRASNLPRKDLASPNDTFVEVGGLDVAPDDVGYVVSAPRQHRLREGVQLTTVAIDNEAPVWEEEFELATLSDGARDPFLRALSQALGLDGAPNEAIERTADDFFPSRWAAAATPGQVAESQTRFAQRCFPDAELA